jgi:CrcB protein
MLLGVIGCSIGGVARHILSTALVAWRRDRFPWGTLFVNVMGSALLGYSFGVAIGNPAWGYMLVGFSGGFTTFSTFSLDNLNLLSQGRRGALVNYILLSLILGGLACYGCGVWSVGKYW